MLNLAMPHARHEILVVEGDASSREIEQVCLSHAGYEVSARADGASALALAAAKRFDLIVLDIVLPDIDGLALCRRLRTEGMNQNTSILMLSSHGAEPDAVAALEGGADDCLIKPFDTRELLARTSALLRRAGRSIERAALPAPRRIEIHGVVIDADRREVVTRGHTTDLTRQEFDLLYLLATRPGVVFRRETLVAALCGGGAQASTRTVDTVVSRLRAKIERNPTEPELILTAWGSGYKLLDD
jgi:DNA-binding response OmpR family regulator